MQKVRSISTRDMQFLFQLQKKPLFTCPISNSCLIRPFCRTILDGLLWRNHCGIRMISLDSIYGLTEVRSYFIDKLGLEKKVDLRRINLDALKPWIADKIARLVADEVISNIDANLHRLVCGS